jgi:hypothetical protein
MPPMKSSPFKLLRCLIIVLLLHAQWAAVSHAAEMAADFSDYAHQHADDCSLCEFGALAIAFELAAIPVTQRAISIALYSGESASVLRRERKPGIRASPV